MNKIVSDKDEELMHIRHELENQESVIDQYRQHIKKEINDYEAEIKWLNKIVSNKDEELMQIRHKLENQESVIDQY